MNAFAEINGSHRVYPQHKLHVTTTTSKSWPSLVDEDIGGGQRLAGVDDIEEDELKEVKGNSLSGQSTKGFESQRPRPSQSDPEDALPTGPLFSDQDQVRYINTFFVIN